ncbi:phage major capsid protein, partial [Vibrio agarivorans]
MLPEEIEKQYKETQASLSQVNDDLKRYAEESQAAIKGARQLSDESKAKVDELLIAQGELKARLEQAEQHMVALESGGSRAAAQSIGQMVAESDAYKGFNGRGSFQVPVQAAITEATGSGGDLITPDRVPGVVAPGEQRLTVRDLLSWGTTGSNSVEFVRETGFTNSAAPVSENPSGGKPESDLTFEAAAANVATIAHWV